MLAKLRKLAGSCVLLITVVPATVIAADTAPAVDLQAAELAVANGAYREAIGKWSTVIRNIRAGRDAEERSDTSLKSGSADLSLGKLLLRRGDAYRRIGFYNRSFDDLQQAVELGKHSGIPILQSLAFGSVVFGSLGDLQMAAEHNQSFHGTRQSPEELYAKSLRMAIDTGASALISAAAIRLGNWQFENGDVDGASETLLNAVFYSEETESFMLQADARVKYARVVRTQGLDADAIDILRNASTRLVEMPAGYSRAEITLALGREAAAIGGPTAANVGVSAFEEVVDLGKSLSDKRLMGSALAEIGLWNLDTGDKLEAIKYLQNAVGVAADAHDLAIDWEWQLARLYAQVGDIDSAMESYRRSISHIDEIRHDIPVSYVDGQSSFRETRAPIYLEYADLLMRNADTSVDYQQNQSMLSRAQFVMEQVKGAELQDYFRDTCVVNQSSSIADEATNNTAVIYPIVLDDRLAVLLNAEGQYYHYSSPVSASRLKDEVDNLARLLRDPESATDNDTHKQYSKRIYDWVVAPALAQIEKSNAQTLFVVPDGVLRTIPFSALWNGSEYLVEQYQVAIAPGLTLLNSDSVTRTKRRTLAAGLSIPGNAVSELPDDYYLEAYSRTLPPGFPRPTRGAIDDLRSEEGDERVRIFHQLGAVETEVKLPGQNKFPSKVLLNEEFRYETFKKEILEEPYQIVHVASHGYFDGEVENSWIMTHDNLIDLGELSDLFKPKEFSDSPVELLVLSACETAEGNDLAPLGLSGVALTSGARSVIGSLWNVPDEPTEILMQGFYGSLAQPGVAKASALRAAQVEFLERDDILAHPHFWSAFILVGNWR